MTVRLPFLIVALCIALCALMLPAPQARAQVAAAAPSHLSQLMADLNPADIAAGADSFGPIRADLPVAPIMGGGQQLGWVYITSDFVGTTGYSGKPIHTAVAVDADARVLGVRLVKHSEPIVLIGIPEAKIHAMTADYIGMDLAAEAQAGGSAHELNIISGATVTIMVIDDSVVRSGLHVARALGLGGLGAAPAAASAGPAVELDPDATAAADWNTLEGDGTVRRLLLDVGTVNETFANHADPRAKERPLTETPDTTFIDMRVALVSHPAIGRALLGDAEYENLKSWLQPGEQAIMVLGNGLYSFKGSGYVRGGIFDRIQLMQGDASVRFRDRQHRRINALAAEGAPAFTEKDLFKIPADAGFDPAQPFRLQLLVYRSVAAIDKAFTTFDMEYRLPDQYLRAVPQPAAAEAAPADATAAPAPAAAPQPDQPMAAGVPASAAPPAVVMSQAAAAEGDAQAQLWRRIWQAKTSQITALLVMLGVLTLAFFFQDFLSRSARAVAIFRYAFLTVTLVWLGWMMNAQLSVVNILALFNSLTSGFSWQAFLLDPMTFILWFAVAAALIFWGRGAYCGWLCPFGALQELTNHAARKLGVPQWRLPWGLHERLWPVKYMIFLGLFAVSLMSLERAEHLAEVEPFKTAIILNFIREWPFVIYAVSLLVIGLFVERFYCRYLCPLGAGLAIPARIRMFDWLKRYRECGSPCQTCGVECPVQAIHPTGQINPNECVNCMHCQVLYHSKEKCPVVQRTLKRRETASAGAPVLDRILNHPNIKAKGN